MVLAIPYERQLLNNISKTNFGEQIIKIKYTYTPEYYEVLTFV